MTPKAVRGRLRSRLRKLARDPAAFADDLPWPPLRWLALRKLDALTRAADRFDSQARKAAAAWREADVALRETGGGSDYAFRDRAGRPPAAWPDRVILAASSGSRLVCAFAPDGRFIASGRTGPDQPAVLSLGGIEARVKVWPLDGSPAPALIEAAPAGRAEVIDLARAAGAPFGEALRQAWPAGRRRAFEPTAAAHKAWILRNEPSARNLEAMRASVSDPDGPPVVSILMPVHDPAPGHLKAAIASVTGQADPRWELCIADDGCRDPTVRAVLSDAGRHPKVRWRREEAARGVAAATNAALSLATAPVVLFLDHDDLLAPHAVARIAAAFADRPDTAAVYSDEDTVDAQGRRSAPLFKPDFDGERLLAQNYLNHAFAVRTDLLRSLGGVREGVDGAQDHDLVLRVAEAKAGPIRHLPEILYHWRSFPGGTSLSQRAPEAMARSRLKVVQDALARRGDVSRAHLETAGRTVIDRPLADPRPSVTAVIPTRDRPGLLAACVSGLLERTDYPGLRIRIVDNGSETPQALALLKQFARHPRVTVLRDPRPFNFSALINRGAEGAESDLLALVNDDVVVIDPDWLTVMAAEAVRRRIGAVGAKLHYPDGAIQHAGVVLGLGPQGIAGHEFRGAAKDLDGPQGRLAVTREVSAVTAACLVVETRKFHEVGGFDPGLAVAFNDVDFCLRLAERGYANLWTPRARLIHVESATRGRDDQPGRAARFAAEADVMRDRWGDRLQADPYYNPNLSLEDETFSPAVRTRAGVEARG